MRTTIHKQHFHSPLEGGVRRTGDVHSRRENSTSEEILPYCSASWQYGVWMYNKTTDECVWYGAESVSSGKFPLQVVVAKKNARSRNYGPFKTKNKKHDAKIINYLEFDTICITNNNIVIDWALPGMDANEQLRVYRADFEQWLYKTCRLDWCLTELISGEHQTQPTYEWIYAHYGISLNDLKTYMVDEIGVRYEE